MNNPTLCLSITETNAQTHLGFKASPAACAVFCLKLVMMLLFNVTLIIVLIIH